MIATKVGQHILSLSVCVLPRTSFQLIGLLLWLCFTSRWAALIFPESPPPPPLLAAPDPELGLWNLAM